jgi:trans-aconitate methyltransferase
MERCLMAGYHKYVFDTEKRKFVGEFEKMYQQEGSERFDSWHERDLRPIRKLIPLVVLNQYNFEKILEIGCGKGIFTQFLKKKNNHVIAIDISKTAIKKASQSFPDIDFKVCDVEYMNFVELVGGGKVDLVVVMGTFAYIKDWPVVLEKLSKITRYFFIGEYVPVNPIGFVKSLDQLVTEVIKNFKIITKIILDEEHFFLFTEVSKP